MKEFKSILNEIQVSYRPTKLHNCKIASSSDASQVFRDLFPVDLGHKEAFTVLMLNRANNTIGFDIVSIGGISGTVADGKVIFQNALKCNASALILCHNHPSGQLKPSEADRKLTRNLIEFGKLIDLQILDHLILTEDSYFSFADEGLM